MRDKGRVAGTKLKPDLVWLRRDAGGDWRKVVVDVKVTSTDKMSEAFKEKDEKYRDWATKETLEEEGRQGGNGPPHHLPRRGSPQRLGQEMEELRPRHHGRLGPYGTEYPALQRRDRRVVLQQGELGVRGLEKEAP